MEYTDQRIQNHTGKTHRTSHFTQAQIEHLKNEATRQEKMIAEWFLGNPTKAVGPSQLHARLGFKWPLTSTRRAITNLTDAGILVKTDRTATGNYGRPEHKWAWRAPQNEPPQQACMFAPPQPKSKAYDL